MARGRKRGCPVNIKNWIIEIRDYAAATVDEEWVRIYGLTSLTRTTSGDTNDGSADTDNWEEPYITKRSGELNLEGEYFEDETTGERDRGQDLLNWYADQVGCENDCTIRMTDPYGHIMIADYVVTSADDDWDTEEANCSWDLEQVGEPEYPPYVHVQSVSFTAMGSTQAITTLNMKVGDAAKIVVVKFTPEDSSNKRFRVFNSRQAFARITDVTDQSITITPVAPGTTTIKVSSINGAKEATLTVTVTPAGT